MPIAVFNPIRLYSHWQVFDHPPSCPTQLTGWRASIEKSNQTGLNLAILLFLFPMIRYQYITVFFFSITILLKVFLLISFYISLKGAFEWFIIRVQIILRKYGTRLSSKTKCWCLRLKVMSRWSIQLPLLPWQRQKYFKVKCSVNYYPQAVSLIIRPLQTIKASKACWRVWWVWKANRTLHTNTNIKRNKLPKEMKRHVAVAVVGLYLVPNLGSCVPHAERRGLPRPG